MNNQQRANFIRLVNNGNNGDLSILAQPTQGGPCGSFVCGLIEHSTGCLIPNHNDVFNSELRYIATGMQIGNIQELGANTLPGDILAIFGIDGHLRHYCVRADTPNANVLSVNGFIADPNYPSIVYNNVMATNITAANFNGNRCLMYDRAQCMLYKIGYTLI